MSAHACDYCDGTTSRTRAAIFATIRAEPEATNVGLARVYGVSRRSVLTWRHTGEAKGCLPARTDFGHSLGSAPRPTPSRMAPPPPPPPKSPPLPPWTPSGPAWPIGTVWTDEATRRRA